MRKIIIFGILGFVGMIVFSNGSAYADVSPYQTDPKVTAKLDQLTEQLVSLQKVVQDQQATIRDQADEIGRLKSARVERPLEAVAVPGEGVEVPGWLDGLKWGGDLRLRYEAFSHSSEGTRDQNRFRFRLRYGFEKALGEDFKVGFRLASGSASDPTSTNQSFDTLFTPKEISINRAYVIYTPTDFVERVNEHTGLEISGVEIGGGKFSNPYNITSQMIWDHDVEPEGMYEKFSLKLLDSLSAYGVFGQYVLEEDATSQADAELYAYKGGFKIDLTKVTGVEEAKPALDSSIAIYDFRDYTETSNFGALARGNSNDTGPATRLDAADFNVLNFYNELSFSAFEKPVKFFVDYAVNLSEHDPDPEDENDAWGLGIKFGNLKKKSDWQASYAFYNVEANSVVGAFSDSDFGVGHADNRGSAVKLGYQLTDYLQLNGAAYFTNRISGAGGDNDVRRFQADLTWKF